MFVRISVVIHWVSNKEVLDEQALYIYNLAAMLLFRKLLILNEIENCITLMNDEHVILERQHKPFSRITAEA